jgi:predicted TIM-barrel fold metal-dependent hydrolase
MYQGPIIDTHHHLWEVHNYPWLVEPMRPRIFGETYGMLRQNYLIGDLHADFAGHNVVKSVHVQAHYDPRDPVGETRWLQSVADVHGFPHAITGHAHLADDRVEETIDAHAGFKNFRGIRDHVMWEPSRKAWQAVTRPDFCLSKEYRRGLRALAARDLHYELQGFPNQFPFFAELIGELPELRVCLVHGGLLTGDDPASFDLWQKGLERLAPLKNLSVKCSGVNNVNWSAARPYASVARQYNTLLDMFGPDRCFFGSNFPVEKLKSTYTCLLDMLKMALAHRPPEEQRAFFHDTAARFYRI